MDLKGAILRNFYETGTIVTEVMPNKYFSLKVPHYQRPYKWDSARVSQLIKDWQENKDLPNQMSKDYFAGAVVTVADEDDSAHSLIDGQQRITTSFLTNYLNFTILRRLLLMDIKEKRCGKIESLSNKLIKSVYLLFRDPMILERFEKAAARIKELAEDEKMAELHNKLDEYDSDSEDVELNRSNPLNEYYDLLWIINPSPKNHRKLQALKDDSVALLNKHIKDNSLNLHYDRSSYNTSLVKVLSHFYVLTSEDTIEISAHVEGRDTMTDSEKVYVDALTAILETFKEITRRTESFRNYLNTLQEHISSFLEQVKFCVIQTGSTDDAYTLFEVMNDRALELDDLDLIKNQLFKAFVQKNQDKETEQDIDEKIQALDKQWGDEIFNNQGIREQDKKLILYLGTVFLTGNDSITNTKKEKYRIYLNDYLNVKYKDEYNEKHIQRDFNIFQICYELIKLVELPYQKREHESLTIEYSLDSTEFKKTIYFLNALRQDGVISGLINFVFKSIAEFSPEFELAFSIKFIKLLLKPNALFSNEVKKQFFEKNESEQQKIVSSILKIQEQSKIIWTNSMMAPTAETPRELAKRIIKENNLTTLKSNATLEIQRTQDTAQLKEEFTEWLTNWVYKKDSTFKIKTLFARLLKFNLQNDGLVDPPVKTYLVDLEQIGSLDLDHMQPQNPTDKGLFNHDDEIEPYIHSIGNMMPLPKKENIKKSNYPLDQSLSFYEQSGLGTHFLLEKTSELLEQVKKGNLSPHDFFTKRRDLLIEYFTEIVK